MSYWYMSFCQQHLPEGERFVGATVVEASSADEALRKATALGLNPGGEVMFLRGETLPPDGAHYLNKFVPRAVVIAEGGVRADKTDLNPSAHVCQDHNPVLS